MIDLAQVDKVSSMQGTHSFLVEEGAGIKRIAYDSVKEGLMSALVTPPATYTLEAGSSPTFEVSSDWAVRVYRSAMGGYMLKVSGGKVYAAKLNPANWNYFADGTKVDDASKYETMVKVPTCYFKGQDKTMQFGGLSPLAGGHAFDSPQWVGAYKMYVDSSDIGHSRPDVSPAHTKTMSDFWSCAQLKGTQWGLANYGFQCLIEALFQASFGNLNSQSAIGRGWDSSSWEACRDVSMGLTRSLGDATGSVLYNDSTLGNQYPTKLFGFEDLWSKLWELRPGIRFYYDSTASKRYAVVYGGNQVSNTATGRTFEIPLLNAGGAYQTKKTLGEYWDCMPTAVGGGESTYYCDGYYDAQSGELLRVGGRALDGSLCGVAHSHSSYGFSHSGSYIGARLAFYGEPVLVSGTELMKI